MENVEKMLDKCIQNAHNPFTVNVITFSGHGLTYNGDAIAVIPETSLEDPKIKVPRYINMSGIARKFAAKKNTFTLIIASMCRGIYNNDKIFTIGPDGK